MPKRRAENEEDNIKKRNPFIAGLLGIICPGLGQLYNTQLKLAFVTLIITCVLLYSVRNLPILDNVYSFLFFLSFILAIFFGSILQAILFSIKHKNVVLKGYNKPYFYIVYIIFASLISNITPYFSEHAPLYQFFNASSLSMAPNLTQGDNFIVKSTSIPPQRGDVFAYESPTDHTISYVKRIIGVPDDTIQLRKGRLYINGQLIARTDKGAFEIKNKDKSFVGRIYAEHLPAGRDILIYETSDNEPLDNTPLYTVPKGYYFMLGDFRDNSLDSRVMNTHGFVPENNLIGKALYVYFSNNFSHIGQTVK